MVPRADGGGLELRAETTASVTGSSGRGVLAPPPDLDGARRRPGRGPSRRWPGPGRAAPSSSTPSPRSARPTHAIDDGRRGFGRTPGRTGVPATPRSEPGRPRGSARPRAG